jgi:hypothetical protein
MGKGDPSATRQLFLCEVLEEEFRRLHSESLNQDEDLQRRFKEYQNSSKDFIKSHIEDQEPERTQTINKKLVPEIYQLIHDLAKDPERPAGSALCLSGGGIRSATFALGIIQGLARYGLLSKFDYLSTVSGGGFIGSWLSAWIYRFNADRAQSIIEVEKMLKDPTKDPLAPEPPEVHQLRSYSHYLNPRAGILSADSWTLVGTYLRNLLINWIAFLPLLLAVLLIPRLCVAVVEIGLTTPQPDWLFKLGVAILSLGLLSGALALLFIGVNRPSSRPSLREPEKFFWEDHNDQKNFLWWCLLPLLVSGICMTTFWAWFSQLTAVQEIHPLGINMPSWFMLFGAFFHFLGWLGYSWWLQRWNFRELLIVLLTGVVGGGLAWLGFLIIMKFQAFSPELIPGIYVCLALPLFIAAFLLAATVFVGLVSRFTDDEDREWWGRDGSWMLIVVVAWLGISSLVIFGPLALFGFPGFSVP